MFCWKNKSVHRIILVQELGRKKLPHCLKCVNYDLNGEQMYSIAKPSSQLVLCKLCSFMPCLVFFIYILLLGRGCDVSIWFHFMCIICQTNAFAKYLLPIPLWFSAMECCCIMRAYTRTPHAYRRSESIVLADCRHQTKRGNQRVYARAHAVSFRFEKCGH